MPRPRLVVHMIQTVDGRITLARGRPTNDAFASLAPNMTAVYREIRDWYFKPQVLLCGSETIFVLSAVKPSPLPPATGNTSSLYEDYLPTEIVERPTRAGWFAVVDSRGRIRWGIKESDGMQLLVLVARRTPPNYLGYLRDEKIPYLVVGKERVDCEQALDTLARKLKVERVVAEGGGRLNGALLMAGLIDEISLVVIPAVIGNEGTPTSFDAPELASKQIPPRLKLISAQPQQDGIVWLRYEVIR